MIAKAQLESVFNTDFYPAQDNWKAKCPFHDEKTPSFYVHKDDLIAHCFGCGISGFIDTLASKHLGVSKEDARKALSIGLEEIVRARAGSPERSESTGPSYFPESWLAPWKKEVHKYALERGFKLETLREAETIYDKATQRQVFPHRDREGRLLGAIGRACQGQEPKWHFYWDYRKGQALYRPFEFAPLRSTIVVEGVFDTLWLHQNGVGNVVGLLGSTATSEQIRQLRNTPAEQIILALDNDVAGREGTRKLYQALRKSRKLKFIDWPEFANDWMDLSKEQIHEEIRSAKNPAESNTLRAATEHYIREYKKHTPFKAGKVRRVRIS